MCGRFALGLPSDEVQRLPGHPNVASQVNEWVNRDAFVPRYNVAPRSQAPVIHSQPSQGGSSTASGEAGLVLHTMKWGLVPHYSKTEDTTLSTINARAENLIEGGSSGVWGSIKGSKRCVIPAQGYYEWLKKGKDRSPHFTRHAGGQLMLLAGLYDVAYIDGQTSPLFTFTIITTSASKSMSWLHDRQPVILSSDADALTWLDNSKPWSPALARLLDPHDDEASPLECYAVPKEVGKVGTESATFIEPISQRKDGIEPISQRKDGIEAMFFKQSHKKTEDESGTPEAGEKRKHSPSPQPERSGGDAKEVGANEADSDVELVKTPKSSQAKSPSPKKTKVETKPSPKKPRPTKTKEENPSSNQKITSYFSKT